MSRPATINDVRRIVREEIAAACLSTLKVLVRADDEAFRAYVDQSVPKAIRAEGKDA